METISSPNNNSIAEALALEVRWTTLAVDDGAKASLDDSIR